MAYNFLPYDERQNFLLPPSILEWVKEDSKVLVYAYCRGITSSRKMAQSWPRM